MEYYILPFQGADGVLEREYGGSAWLGEWHAGPVGDELQLITNEDGEFLPAPEGWEDKVITQAARRLLAAGAREGAPAEVAEAAKLIRDLKSQRRALRWALRKIGTADDRMAAWEIDSDRQVARRISRRATELAEAAASNPELRQLIAVAQLIAAAQHNCA